MAKTKDRLYFEYTECEAGWISFSIRYNKTKLDYTFSYLFSDPGFLIEWSEKVYKGEFTEFTCFSEGWQWFFDYDGKYFSVSDTCNFMNENPEYEKYLRLKIAISKDDLCKTLYSAIKTFQKSGLYKPHEWESLTFKDLLLEAYGNSDKIIDTLKTMNLKQIIADLKNHYSPDNYRIERFEFLDEEYNQADEKERKEILEDAVEHNDDYLGFGGFPVMKIYSPILERLL